MKSIKIFLSFLNIFVVTIIFQKAVQAQPGTGIDAITSNLNGRVSIVISGFVNEKNNKRELTYKTKYNRQGYKVEEVYFMKNPGEKVGSPLIKTVFTINRNPLTQRSYDIISPRMNIMPAIAGIIVNGKLEPLPPPPIREPDGALLHQALNKREKNDGGIEVTWYEHFVKNSVISHRISYILDKSGKVTEQLFYSPEITQPERQVYKYNPDGAELEIATYKPDGNLHSKRAFSNIKLDSQRNWIQRTVDQEGSLFIEYREITYYPSAK